MNEDLATSWDWTSGSGVACRQCATSKYTVVDETAGAHYYTSSCEDCPASAEVDTYTVDLVSVPGTGHCECPIGYEQKQETYFDSKSPDAQKNENHVACTKCTSGKYNNAQGATACLHCATNKYSGTAATGCAQCPAVSVGTAQVSLVSESGSGICTCPGGYSQSGNTFDPEDASVLSFR